MTRQPKSPPRLAFVDTETTGLDPDVHEVWEVGLIVREPATRRGDQYVLKDGTGTVLDRYSDPDVDLGVVDREYVWQLPVDLSSADAVGLDVGRFHERRWRDGPVEGRHRQLLVAGDPEGLGVLARYRLGPSEMAGWAARFAELTWGATLIGAVPSFDEERLRRLLRRHGACPGWHYHLVDVETLAVGYLAAGGPVPPNPALTAEKLAALRTPPWKSRDLSRAIGVEPDQYDEHTALGDARWARAIYDRVTGR